MTVLALVLAVMPSLAGGADRVGSSAARAARPVVSKVEPPSWWPGHSQNPLRLLLSGRNLAGAHLSSTGAGLEVGPTRVSAAGTYLFADLRIDPGAHPGPRRLRVTTPAGAAEASFELLPPLSRDGRFQGFSADDVIYLLMPDRFDDGDPANDDPPRSRGLLDRGRPRYYHGGDLQGIIDRIPYLKGLGVSALWLNPVFDNVNHLNERETYDGQAITDYHGYGAIDFYAVDEHLGDVARFRELVEAAHRAGIKVIQDQVANHTGPYHPWAADPPTPTWFNGTAAQHVANTWQTWTLMDPHATPEVRRTTLDGWFIDILPDLNQDDEEVARYLIQNTLWWVGITGLDGIRQDTLPYVPRRFWREWMAAVKREHPNLTVVGELFDGDPALVSFYQGGQARFDGIDSGIDSLFDFPLFFPLRRAFAEGKPLREVANMLARDHLYTDASSLVTFLGLHDVRRFMNEPGATLDGLRLAFTFLLTARGTPMIYYGDEIAMPGGEDPDNRRDFPGGWRTDARDAFTPSGRTPEEASVFERVARLTALRSERPPLRRGRMENLLVGEQTWAYARVLDGRSVVVVFNNGSQAAAVEFGAEAAGLSGAPAFEDLLGGGPAARVDSGRVTVTLPPRTAAVYAAPTAR